VRWLGETGGDELPLVGGKAANLSWLAARQQVPTGFSLTTRAFEAALAAAPADGKLTVPPTIQRQIAAAYDELSRRAGSAAASVAVRSSAVDEDGAAASFAGQHETYLNVVGAEAVIAAVERCWESASSERARAYRWLHGLTERSSLAVLVQLLVPADVSGVAFSANPLTNSRDEVVVNASWGLGESIVGGTVTPDTYFVGKRELEVRRRDIADKARMTVLAPGGTREVEVPRLLRGRLSLDDDRVARVARLAVDLEATMGWPVDLEWAFKGDQLYLLQCRPITTIRETREIHHDAA
jgi:pyruvate,water dikinase